jgi:hypothetical protein
MNRNRKQILEMVADGRINAWQAERLLIASSEERESRWIFGACAAPAAISFLHSVWLWSLQAGVLQHAVSQFLGGVR